MYERKIPVDLDCPLRLTMSLIDSKWKSCILDELRHRALRPSELHKIFPEATPRVLDLQLKELVEDGLVSKTIYPELPPRSEYAITPLGMTLIPIIDAMIAWGEKNTELLKRNMGNGNRIWLLFTIFALRQELFDRNLPHIAEFVTVSKSLPRFLRNAYK